MHSTKEIVINTGPILAMVAALGSLEILQMYRQVWVPWEVCQEVLVGGPDGFAVVEFQAAHWLRTEAKPLEGEKSMRFQCTMRSSVCGKEGSG